MHQPPIPQLDAEDPEIAGLIHDEARRQQDKFRLIASENYVSAAVLEASGTLLTNKYSEGYPGKRYYEGQQFIDPIESIAVSRAQALFGVEHANVQPYSGSPANLAVYLAFASPGDTVMGLALAMGGHLTHGAGVAVGGKWFNSLQYGVRRDTGRIDFDEVRDLALRERPKIIFCGGTALPRTVDFPAFAEIAAEVDAVLVADIAHIAGLVAGGAHPSPVGFAAGDHHHHAQDAARPPRRDDHDRRRARDRRRQGRLPRPAGRTAQPHDGRHRGGAARGGPAVVPPLRRPGGGQRRRARRRRCRPGATTWCPAAPTTTCCWWTSPRRGSAASRPRRRWTRPASS